MTKLEWLYWGVGVLTGAGGLYWLQLVRITFQLNRDKGPSNLRSSNSKNL